MYQFKTPLSCVLLSSMAVALAGCAGLPLQSATGVAGQASLAGELTTRSGVNVNNGSRYQNFRLRLKGGEVIQVRQSGGLNTELVLLDEHNSLIAGPGSNGLTLAPARDGTYTLNVSGASSSDYGPFSLSLKHIEAHSGGALVAGESFAGLLAKNGNDYQLKVDKAGIYTVDLASDEFDTVLLLQGNGVELENDDFGDSSNSHINAFLEPGDYHIKAKSLDSDKLSATFTIAVERKDVPVGVKLSQGGPLREGQSVNGISSMVPVTFSISLVETAQVKLQMRSSEIDALLNLSGNGVEIADDDSGGGVNGTDAMLNLVLQPGNYSVQAQSVGGQSGLFSLAYSATPARRGDLARLEPGQYSQGTLSANRPSRSTLVVHEAGDYVIDLVSSDFDAYLGLVGENIELEDDDSGGSRNARINAYLEAGEYRLNISAVGSPTRGRFVLSVRPDA